jgi:hypothetical protein
MWLLILRHRLRNLKNVYNKYVVHFQDMFHKRSYDMSQSMFFSLLKRKEDIAVLERKLYAATWKVPGFRQIESNLTRHRVHMRCFHS